MLLGVGREQPQDELQEPPAGAEQGLLRAGRGWLRDLGAQSLAGGGGGGKVTLTGGDLLVAAGIREAFFSRAGMAGSASIAARAACAPASAELAACSAFFAWA